MVQSSTRRAAGFAAVAGAAVLAALHRGWECVGIHDGFNGLWYPSEYPDGGVMKLNARTVRGTRAAGRPVRRNTAPCPSRSSRA